MKGSAVVVLAVVALVGCSASQQPTPAPSTPSASVIVTPPTGGVLLTSLGFQHAPQGFSIPANAQITDRVDQSNQVTAVFSAPDGFEMAAYLRKHLPSMGFHVTGDKDNALLFTSDTTQGAFYAEGSLSSLSLRRDQEG